MNLHPITTLVAGIAMTLCSCATIPDIPPDVAELAASLGEQWQGNSTEDAIFLRGTNALASIWQLEQTDGYTDNVYDRARRIAQRFESSEELRLVNVRRLFSGELPVVHRDLSSAISLAIPLLVRNADRDKWEAEQTLVSHDGTRAQVRCSVYFGPLSATGWLLVFENRNEAWTLVLIERTWVS